MLVYGCAQGHVNATSRISLHPRHHVAVKIKRGADIRMAEALLGNLGMYATRKQVRGVRVTQIVKSNAR